LAFSQRNQETAARKSAKKLANSCIFVGQKGLDGKVMKINNAARVIYYSQHWFLAHTKMTLKHIIKLT
jgi:hypothetical protein